MLDPFRWGETKQSALLVCRTGRKPGSARCGGCPEWHEEGKCPIQFVVIRGTLP